MAFRGNRCLSPPTLKVFVVDDHPTLRIGLKALIGTQHDLRVVGEADSIGPALTGMDASRPDVAVIDIALREENGLALIRAASQRFPAMGIMALSMHPEETFGATALRAGARGYLNKTASPRRLLAAIRSVGRGAAWPEQLAPGRARGMESMTDRERQVFLLLGEGKRVKEIALMLDLSPKTVETHCLKLRKKLGVDSLFSLTRMALRGEHHPQDARREALKKDSSSPAGDP
jgi:two-component system nitrate/nitrite response regulator NarL